MKTMVFSEKEIEKIKKSGIIKYGMLSLATPIGLIMSGVLAKEFRAAFQGSTSRDGGYGGCISLCDGMQQ